MIALRIACLGLVLCTPAMAMDFGQGLAPPSAARLLANGNGESRHWTGIGRLDELPGNRQCMGTLLDTRAPGGAASGPAYVLTAGHCVSKRNGVIVQDQPLKATITFNYFTDTLAERYRVAVHRAVWSSIQGRDLALLELDATLQQLLDQGIAPLMMAAPVPAGSAVLVVGEASRPDIGLRLSACTEQDLPILMEQPWVWRRLKSNDCRGIAEGVSGSPVLDTASNRVVGVINSVSGERAASIPVRGLLGCFSNGRVDLDVERCHLLPGFQLVQQPHAAFKRLYKLGTDNNGNTPPPSWNFAFTLDTQRYRYKATRDALACEDPDGYSGTLPAMGTVLINDPIGPETGWHFLCVVGVDSAEDLAWRGLLANALSIAVQLLPAVAVPAPDMTVERLENGDTRVSWRTEPPHLQRYRVKKGKPAQTDCADLSDYRMLRHQRYVFKRAELPLKLCSQAEDIAKQRSAPREDLLEAVDR